MLPGSNCSSLFHYSVQASCIQQFWFFLDLCLKTILVTSFGINIIDRHCPCVWRTNAFTCLHTQHYQIFYCSFWFCNLRLWLVVESQDRSSLPGIFHYTAGHHAHTAGDKPWCKPIPGRHQPRSKPLHRDSSAPTPGQTWARLGRGSRQAHAKGQLQQCLLLSPGALLCCAAASDLQRALYSFKHLPAWDTFPLNFMSCLKRLLKINAEDRLGKQA